LKGEKGVIYLGEAENLESDTVLIQGRGELAVAQVAGFLSCARAASASVLPGLEGWQ
jgi:hypothetical protein